MTLHSRTAECREIAREPDSPAKKLHVSAKEHELNEDVEKGIIDDVQRVHLFRILIEPMREFHLSEKAKALEIQAKRVAATDDDDEKLAFRDFICGLAEDMTITRREQAFILLPLNHASA